MDRQHSDFRDVSPLEGLESAFDWWREAGVDLDFSEDPQAWLVDPAEESAAVATPPPPPKPVPPPPTALERATAANDGPAIGGDRQQWPQDLDQFRNWWMSEPTLAPGTLARRVPPRGISQSRLMVLVAQPGADDADGLLSGAEGGVLAAMLRAMGIAGHEAYLASVLPAPIPLPDWHDLPSRGFSDITRHHIRLAAPERVLVIGRDLAPIFDLTPAQLQEPSIINFDSIMLPLLVAPALDQLARSAGRRQRFWQNWLDWTR